MLRLRARQRARRARARRVGRRAVPRGRPDAAPARRRGHHRARGADPRRRSPSSATPTSTRASARLANLDEDAYESILAVPVLARERLVGRAQRAHASRRASTTRTRSSCCSRSRPRSARRSRTPSCTGRSQRRIAELEALDRIARACIAPLDLDEVLRDVVRDRRRGRRTPTSAPWRSLPARGPPLEVAVRSGRTAARRRRAGRTPRRARRSTSRACWPCRSRRGAAASARSSAPVPTAPPFTRAERGAAGLGRRAGRLGRGRRARRDARACWPRRSTTASRTTCRPWPRCCGSPPSSDADPHRALRDSVGRVLAIAEVHDLLTSTREDDVDGADLVRRLTAMLRQTVGGDTA